MSDITHENVTSWRDLADQLTREQVAKLQDSEHNFRTKAASLPAEYPYEWPPRSESEIGDILLCSARIYAGDNLGAKLIGGVAPPAGASYVGDWDDARFGVDAALRYFRGSKRVIGRGGNLGKDITVATDGLQYADGRINREITTALGDYEALDPLTSEQARQLAAALIAASDEIDRLSSDS
jgi:hypothetical protein